ncbi:MAG TPA: hypothetical protein VGF59_06250 [Bryobacteraceae bacterium]|jgi:hypothetical protein
MINDHELDQMLDQWESPPMRESLRDDLRSGFAASLRRARRVSLLRRTIAAMPKIRPGRVAVATMAAAALVFGVIQVAPQTVRMASSGFRIPYYVEFEIERFADDGSAPHQIRITSFPYGGHEIVMSVTESSGTLLNAFQGIANTIRTQFILAMPSLVLPNEPPMTEPAWFAGFVSSGCSDGKIVVGHEVLAGHDTTVIQSGPAGYRTRIWLAPDLKCFALKLTDEIQAPDGRYRLRLRKEAVKVTMNP